LKISGTVKELITDRKSGSLLQTPASNPAAHEQLDDFALDPNQPKVSAGINKNSILSEYQEFCHAKGHNDQVPTIVKGKTPPTTAYPTHHCLIADILCTIA
jgi:hypothetical protein